MDISPLLRGNHRNSSQLRTIAVDVFPWVTTSFVLALTNYVTIPLLGVLALATPAYIVGLDWAYRLAKLFVRHWGLTGMLMW